MSKFTVTDFPLLSKATRERWKIPEKTRQDVVAVCEQALSSQDPELQLKAAAMLQRLDSLNLRHEEIFTPRATATLDIASLTNEEIMERINALAQAVTGGTALPVGGTGKTEAPPDKPVPARQLSGKEPA